MTVENLERELARLLGVDDPAYHPSGSITLTWRLLRQLEEDGLSYQLCAFRSGHKEAIFFDEVGNKFTGHDAFDLKVAIVDAAVCALKWRKT